MFSSRFIADASLTILSEPASGESMEVLEI